MISLPKQIPTHPTQHLAPILRPSSKLNVELNHKGDLKVPTPNTQHQANPNGCIPRCMTNKLRTSRSKHVDKDKT